MMRMSTLRERLEAFSITTQDLDENYELVDVKVPVPFFERDGKFFISGEHETSWQFMDYYGEWKTKEWPWIHPELQALAKKAGGHWDWQNPGCLYFEED